MEFRKQNGVLVLSVTGAPIQRDFHFYLKIRVKIRENCNETRSNIENDKLLPSICANCFGKFATHFQTRKDKTSEDDINDQEQKSVHMDFRSTKVFDYVAAAKHLTENEKKRKAVQIKWFHNYEWLCDKYRILEKRLEAICNEKLESEGYSAKMFADKRDCLPFPETNNSSYGWLASKPDFQYQRYGGYIVKYPSPMDEITMISGDIPTLGHGKGFF